MGNLIKDIEVFDELLKAGVETKKYVGYKSWGQVLKTLAEETGKRIVQLPNGQVCEILSGVGESSAGATTGLSTYGMAAVNVTETEILAGDAVISSSGEVITLGETTTGLVVSGTSDVATAGALGTTTACESGFMLTPKTALIAGVAGICGFAIGDAIAGKIAAELNGENFDWGSDTIVGNLVNKLQDQILMRIEPGGKTSFDADLIDRIYNELVKKGFFDEGREIFNPESFEPGQTYTFNNLVSVKKLAQQQVNIIKNTVDIDSELNTLKVTQFPNIPKTVGYNATLFNSLDKFVNMLNEFDETEINGVCAAHFIIVIAINDRYSNVNDGSDGAFVYVNYLIKGTDKTEGVYEEHKQIHNNKEFIGKSLVLDGRISIKEQYIGNESGAILITNDYNSNEIDSYNSGVNTYRQSEYYLGANSFIGQEVNYKFTKEIYNFGTFNVGTFSQKEEKYKKRKLPNAKTPDTTKSLAENYPEWGKNTKEQSTPTEKDKNKKKKYRYIGGIINPNLDQENKNLNDQDKAQKGENDDKNLQDKWPSIKEIIDNIINPPTDPSDPKPKPEGENPKPFVPANPVSESGFVSLYTPSLSELKAFSSWLWSTDFSNSIKKLFQDPMNAIIGLHMIYTEPEIGERKNIVVGYVDSNVNTRTVANQYKKIDCGSIAVREYYGDSRDYDFTKISIYLPFLGIQQLNAKDLIGGSINVTATVDVLTGTILYNLNITKNGVTQTLYTFSGNCAVQLPISSGSYASILANTIGLVAGGVATFATGGAAAPVLIGAAAQAVTGTRANVTASNTIGSNAGAMGIKKPYLILNRQNSYNATAYNNIQGYPSNINVKLSNCSGFTRVKECHLDGIPATDEEIEEIYTLLKQGVIL